MKKICTLFCMVVVILSTISASALAAEPDGKVIDLGDGFYVVETITQYPLTRSGDTVRGNTSGNLYYGPTLVGTATLYATFDISGSSARAEEGHEMGWAQSVITTLRSENKHPYCGICSYWARLNAVTRSLTRQMVECLFDKFLYGTIK